MSVPNGAASDFALNWGRQGVSVGGETASRQYSGARVNRLSGALGSANTSADSELRSSLTELRTRSRQLVRDAAYAKRARTIVVNNVIGPGIGMQAQVMTSRDALNDRVNDDIEAQWEAWGRAKNCHTGGAMHFADLERAAMAQIFEAGEVFIRKHYRAFGGSAVPLALELIEAERIADDSTNPIAALSPGAVLRMGIEVDGFGRPLAYWVRQRHPGELRLSPGESDRLERVPADQMIHLRIVDRWPQTRGEPWLHAVVRKLNDMDGYSEAEIVAARGAACYMATIQTPDGLATNAGEEDDEATDPEVQLEPGMVQRLANGETLNFVAPNRPNAAMDPFMRMMLREVAAGAGTSYESLSRDYSQSNYSSSRLALLDDRDLWRVFQQWFIRNFRVELHEEWLRLAVYAGAVSTIPVAQFVVDPAKFSAVRFKPRGWSWIDPTKEVEAYKEAVRNGFTTVSDVIAQTGGGDDIEDVINRRARELEMMEAKGLQFDTDPAADAKAETAAVAPEPKEPEPAEPTPRVIAMGAKR